jgi:hypothetical protein
MKHLTLFEHYLNESDRTSTEGQPKEKLDEASLALEPVLWEILKEIEEN